MYADSQPLPFPQQIQKPFAEHRDFFQPGVQVTVARAPGRLDVMGGIADYSGSVVLEMPLEEAAYAFLQPRGDGTVRIKSVLVDPASGIPQEAFPVFETSTEVLGMNRNRDENDKDGIIRQTARFFQSRPEERWAAYVAGCWPLLALDRKAAGKRHDLAQGANLLLVSEVPLGAGVSSSAAIEVATMRALSAAYDIELSGLELATLCQTVENRIVGAPCGIMDQVTSALGRAGELLELKCQPHHLLGYRAIPEGYAVAGLDSGVKHSVGGTNYVKARTATFMGREIIRHLDEKFRGLDHLANVTTLLYREEIEPRLPETLTGRSFLEHYETHGDPVTSIEPEVSYAVRACTGHPIHENARVRRFIECLESVGRDAAESLIIEAGELMVASHRSYGENCGLGSAETDFIVEEVRQRGAERGLYGAKITGGGSGGTVAVLLKKDREAERALEEVRAAYERRYGIRPRRFAGSSPGAMSWPPRRIDLNSV